MPSVPRHEVIGSAIMVVLLLTCVGAFVVVPAADRHLGVDRSVTQEHGRHLQEEAYGIPCDFG
jgi:hypothetical protein